MIYSMTGFAVATADYDFGSLTIEIRAVNHRYLDVQFRMPDELRASESALRELFTGQLNRGKVECRIAFNPRSSNVANAELNLPLLQQLAQWSQTVHRELPAAAELSVGDILRWQGMTNSSNLPVAELQAAVLAVVPTVLKEFNASRGREGDKLKDFLLQRVGQIESLRVSVAPHVPAAIAQYESKLRQRLLDALGGNDDERVRQEITLFASKIDVDEELSRLNSHLTEMRRILENGGATGKRLDFLMQELNREANTLGSKSVDAEVSRSAMEMKVLIEQMREQIQNLE
jgi:uncharacterized protein (TIGR00255 family)